MDQGVNANWLFYVFTHVTHREWTLIGCRHANGAPKFKYFNFSEICHDAIHVNALARGRGKCRAVNQILPPVFQATNFARSASLRWLCIESCRAVALGVNTQLRHKQQLTQAAAALEKDVFSRQLSVHFRSISFLRRSTEEVWGLLLAKYGNCSWSQL